MDKTQDAMGKIIKRCWEDNAFQKRFMSEPHAVLKEYGVEVPSDMEFKVVQNTDNVHYFAIPAKPSDELSEGALDQVSGGTGIIFQQKLKYEIKKLTGVGGGTHDPGMYCIAAPC
jgi:hypothetical protein